MRKLLLLILFFGFITGASAQNSNDISIAKKALYEQAEDFGIDRNQIENFKVSDHYVSKLSKATHLYLWQTQDGIPVYNGIITFGIKNGEIYNLTSNATRNIESLISPNAIKLSPENAIKAAGEQLGFPNSEVFQQIEVRDEQSFVYAPASFASNNIPVFLCYDINEQGEYVKAWNVDLDIPGSDYWSVRIDAETGKIISQNNYTVYCQFDDSPSHFHTNKCTSNFNNNSDKEVTNKTNEAIINSMIVNESSSYRVYPLPAESPNHGDHEIIDSPFDELASPFGWHDTNGEDGAEYTITRGNNVYAYLDKNDDNVSDGSEPDGGADLVFDFDHDKDLEPADSERAAQVNLFYMNNMMHDITYRYGFDEEAGNFQANNYGKGGNSGDHVEAQSADGSGTNNANFSTPPDGSSGRMQMFLWGGSEFDLLTINSPAQVAGSYEVRSAQFGGPVTDTPITGDLIIVDDGSSESTTGCNELVNGKALEGNIALIDRGLCDFSLKTFNAQEAGAIAVIVCNIAGVDGGDGSEIFNMGGGENAELVTIPAIMATLQDCNKLKASIEADVAVNATIQLPQETGPAFLDGSFDNGIIAHEYGHGISNRLVGGPTNVACLINEEQMGEGWSDFFALVTTVEPGDMGTDARGMGTYASGEKIDGNGIRRFKYSTDMDICPLTYNDIIGQYDVDGEIVVWNVGEIMAATLWDLYWKLIDVYGYDADINNMESGNSIAISLVIQGMKETKCNPSYLDARDGIIAADNALYDGKNLKCIWEVFARRGLGFDAIAGSANDISDNQNGFEIPPEFRDEIVLTKEASNIVESGKEFQVTLNAFNYRKLDGENTTGVVITDEIPEGAEYVDGSANIEPIVDGNMLIFEVGDMAPEDTLTINYNLLATEGGESITYFIDDMEDGDDNWEIEINEGVTAFWELSDFVANSGNDAWYIPNSADEETDNELNTAEYYEITGERPALKFYHSYNTETGADGGFIAVQEEGQENWTRLNFDTNIRNGFNIELAYTTFAIPALAAFSGSTDGEFVDTYLDLSDYIGKKLRFQFRFGTNEMGSPTGSFNGWAVDDFEIIDLKDYSGNACIKDDIGDGNCANSLTVSASSGIVDVEALEPNDFGMEVYPNPASGLVNISLASNTTENAILSIYSVDGTMVMNSTIALSTGREVIQLPISNLSKGFYVVQLKGSSKTSIKRLIVE